LQAAQAQAQTNACKRVCFSATQKEIQFFSPPPSVFYFFATHNRHKNSWTETAKTNTGQGLTMTEDRRPACNSGFAKKRVQWLIEHSTSHQILWYVNSFVLRNPLLRKAAKRWWQVYTTRPNRHLLKIKNKSQIKWTI